MRDHRVAASNEVEPTRESPEATTRNPSSPAECTPAADLEESMTRANGESDERPYAREGLKKGAGKGAHAHGGARAILESYPQNPLGGSPGAVRRVTQFSASTIRVNNFPPASTLRGRPSKSRLDAVRVRVRVRVRGSRAGFRLSNGPGPLCKGK